MQRSQHNPKRALIPILTLLIPTLVAPGCASRTAPLPEAQASTKPALARTETARAIALPSTFQRPLPEVALARAQGTDQGSIADIVERVVPSVVNIAITKVTKAPGMPSFPFFGPDSPFGSEGQRERRDQGMGSGVIVSADGVILTNNHVVEGAEEITVTTYDKQEFKAKVVGTDPKSDLAVIRLEGAAPNLTPMQLGNSSRLRLGDVVLAIGNPFGVGQTVTMGIVSAKGRADLGITDYEDFIQTDAAINPGNSGGALVDMEGNLVGVNTAILSRSGGYQGIGFSIPTQMAKPIMESLILHGKVDRGWLGIGIQDVNQDLAQALKLKTATGVLVSEVKPGGPADKGGIKRGDVIVKVDDTPVDSTGRLRNLVASAGSDHSINLGLVRDGQGKTLAIKLGMMDASDAAPGNGPKLGRDNPKDQDGLAVETLDAEARSRYRIDSSVRGGVVVALVRPDSAGARAGLQRGDVILEVQRQPVSTQDDFARLYKQAKGNVLLVIHRGGATLFLVVKR